MCQTNNEEMKAGEALALKDRNLLMNMSQMLYNNFYQEDKHTF